MLSKGLYYLALLIAKGFLVEKSGSPFSSQIESGQTNEAFATYNPNLDDGEFLPKSIYEVH